MSQRERQERALDMASAADVRQQQEAELRRAVHRQWRAGLTDSAIARVLHVHRRKVGEVREALGLPRNTRSQT